MRSDLMKGVLATTLGVGLVAGVALIAPAIAQDALPEGPGKAETVTGCGGCHGIGQLIGEHRSAEMWATTVTSMINNGAPVADADFDKVVAYLATYFGEGPVPAAAAPASGATQPPAGGTAPAANPAAGAPAMPAPGPATGATLPPAGGTAPAPAQ